MYITITDIIGKKRIDLSYPIKGKDIAVVGFLIGNVQYWLKGSIYRGVAQNGKKNCV